MDGKTTETCCHVISTNAHFAENESDDNMEEEEMEE